jgi:Outer membrane protein beta-barrel domain
MIAKRFILASAGILLSCGIALAQAQAWGVGASVGLTNDVDHRFALDEFRRHDVNAWVQYEIEERVVLRGSFGSLRVSGSKAGTTQDIGGSPTAPLPDLTDRMNYGTLGISYEFWEGTYTSGLFAGIGGYRIEPEAVEPGLESFRDARETVFGLHVGLDSAVQLTRRLSVLARLTVHKIKSAEGHSILTANAGLVYRF